MPYKRGQEWLRAVGRTSIFGEGLLERARAISLALLGVTGAVGLAIIALAMNQNWPLVAGSAIPVISPQHQAIGKATVAAEMHSAGPVSFAAGTVDRSPSPGPIARKGDGQRSTDLVSNSAPAELVVAPSSPAKPDDSREQGSPKQEPTPAVQPPQQAAQASPGPPAAEPVAVPVSQPPVATAPPGATTSEVPASESESDEPSWGHGGGHGYGHDDWGDDDDDWGDSDSRDWGDHDHGGWHGHGYGD